MVLVLVRGAGSLDVGALEACVSSGPSPDGDVLLVTGRVAARRHGNGTTATRARLWAAVERSQGLRGPVWHSLRGAARAMAASVLLETGVAESFASAERARATQGCFGHGFQESFGRSQRESDDPRGGVRTNGETTLGERGPSLRRMTR